MKILLVSNYYYVFGGPERYLFELMALLEARGHIAIPFSVKDEKNFKTRYTCFFGQGAVYNQSSPIDSSFYKIRVGFNSIYSLSAKRNIERLIAETKPDIAHIQSLAYRVTPSIIQGIRKYDIPIVYTCHSHYPICPNQRLFNSYSHRICEECRAGRFYKAILQRCIKGSYLASMTGAIGSYLSGVFRVYTRSVDLFIAPSEYMRKKMLEFGYLEERVFHISNFLNLKRFSPKYTNQNYIIYYGVLTKPKGIFTLLKAVKNIKNIDLKIVGVGDIMPQLVTYAKDMGVSKRVHFHGYVGEEELFFLVQGSGFSILPSEAYEISPMSIYESFALGKPVIGSNIGGIPGLIEDGVTGLLFEPGNADDLTAKINYLLSRPKKIVEMGKNARRKAEQDYNEEIHYDRLTEVYERAIADRRKR